MKKLAYLFLAIMVASCSSPSSFETASGTKVTYVKKGDGETPVDSLISMFRIKYSTESGYIMSESKEPRPLKIGPNNELDQGELFNILSALQVGDSVTCGITAFDLYQKTFRVPIPDSIPGDSKIQFEISYVDQLTEDGYYEMIAEKAEEASAKQLAIDNEIIDNYFAENNIEAEVTESGLRYVITQQGDGPKPEVGQSVQVNYTGWVLGGEYFDSSVKEIAMEKGLYDERREPYGPLSFPLGQGRVIKGWDEGIGLLNVGSTATLYIPSTLGYGSRNRGPVLVANSILVFDVELVGIE